MSLNKKLLASAIAGLLFSANAGAVILGTDDARVYASELEAPVDLSADAADTASFEIGYNFSEGEVRYGRFECSTNLTMDNVVVSTPPGDITLGAINGEGTSALFFSMTAGLAPAATDAIMINVDGDNELADGNDVTCAFSIYDQPSQAQAGGATGRIYTTGNEPFISRASGFAFTATPGEAIADVEAANGAYFNYLAPNWVLGTFQFMAAPGVLNDAGVQIVLADIFSPDTTVTFEGDYSVAVHQYAWNYIDSNWYLEDDLDADAGVATFIMANFTNDFDSRLEIAVTGDAAIPAGDYTASLHADANPGYTVADILGLPVGSIIRNGTQLQAPLAQLPTDWVSRIALTNTGSLARAYEISVMGETGVTFTTDATKLVGEVPAHGTKVIDLNQVITGFSAGSRGTVNVTVAAPDSQIQGLYQIVNPSAGSISNHVMVRPGTN